MRILAIETSCDETAAAVVKSERNKIIVEAALFSSQIPLHRITKGVVPEVAARAHAETIIPTIAATMKKAKTNPENIDAIAVTRGPGLFTSLMVGVDTAKFLATIWNKPLISIQHIEGHIYANFIGDVKCQMSNVKCFPAVCLAVSGGHTMLVLMKSHLHYKILGSTLDDAAGEAFDKTATLLGLPYPGGPAIAREAAQWNSQFPIPNFQSNSKTKTKKISLPRPMMHSKDYNFSFSGLKTAVLYDVQSRPKNIQRSNRYIQAMSANIQQAIVDVLVAKTIRAAQQTKARTVLLAGGVAANQYLRKTLETTLKKECPKTNFLKPELAYTTDNAAMIGAAAVFHAQAKHFMKPESLTADPNLPLKSIDKK